MESNFEALQRFDYDTLLSQPILFIYLMVFIPICHWVDYNAMILNVHFKVS